MNLNGILFDHILNYYNMNVVKIVVKIRGSGKTFGVNRMLVFQRNIHQYEE